MPPRNTHTTPSSQTAAMQPAARPGLLLAAGLAALFAVAAMAMLSPRAAWAQTQEPMTVEVSASGNSVVATVLDAAGAPVATSVPVRFTTETGGAGIATSCVMSVDGVASTSVALGGLASATVVVTADWNAAGAATASCASAGAHQASTAITVGAGAGPGAGAVPGAGAFVSLPVFSSGAVGLAQVVFSGGTVTQLETAMTTAAARGAWAQNASGEFVLFISGAPPFANEPFVTAFPAGFASVTALTLVAE